MSLYIVDIHGELEGDYEIIKKYEEPTTKNDLGVDCIDRNKAYEIIENWAEAFDVGTYFDNEQVKEIIMACANRIDELPSVTPQPRWIPVTERLPEIHNYTEKYLVTLERGWVHTAIFTECDGNHWWSYDDVIAWQPLPEPYKADMREVEK